MPTREFVNQVREKNGVPSLSDEEFQELTRIPDPDPPTEVDQRTIDIRLGLVDPNKSKKKRKTE